MSCSPLIWNYGPDLFHIGSYPIKWYSLLFASCFVLGRQFGIYVYKKEGKDPDCVDVIITYMMVGTTLGARLGHVFFYDWDYFSHHLLEILLPFRFEPVFKFQGFSGLASHGAAIGILIAIFLYTRCKFDIKLSSFRFKVKLYNRPGQSFLWLMDKIVIGVALSGFLIRMGNFMNSEIYGKPTDSNFGVIFVRDAVNKIAASGNFIENVSVNHTKQDLANEKSSFKPLTIQIKFKKGTAEEEAVKYFLEKRVKYLLSTGLYTTENIYEPEEFPILYSIEKNAGSYIANIYTTGIVRHPSQLYEAITCIMVFFLLLALWYRRKEKTREGSLAGLFIIIVFTLRIFHEMLKEGEVVYSNELFSITNAQMLSIPMIIVGIIFYCWNFKKNNDSI